MNRTKRPGNFRQLQALKRKKYREIGCIEDLSNEMFYEIFDYLDGYDIYRAFSNLNIHLENLLVSSSLLMKIEITSFELIDYSYQRFINSNKHHIISIDFDFQSSLEIFMKFFTIDSSFSRLQSIILNKISTIKLPIILFYLKSLSHLSALSICLTDCQYDLGHIYQMIFHLPLKYFRVAVPRHPQLSIDIPIAAKNQFSSIEYLLIYHRCTFNQLNQILSHTPRLSHLHCFNMIESEDEMQSQLTIKLNHLTHFALTLYNVEFDEFEEFLLKICSQLQSLKVKIQNRDGTYLDARRWEQLISRKMTSLTKFVFRYADTMNDDFQITSYHSLINRFTSSFWINRKWIFKLLVEEDELIYSVRPYEESWIDFQEYMQIHQDLKNPSCPSVELSVEGDFLTAYDKPLIKKINPILNLIHITYLDIDCQQMSISMIIVIFKALRNLTSIRISFPSLHEQMVLNTRDSIILKEFLKNNQITKITLQSVFGQDKIDFILNHFPRLKYFAFDQVRGIDLKSFVRYLIRHFKNNHPMTICVFSDDATHDRLDKLYQMIDSRNLLQNYTIHRQYDRFYLQWK